MSLITLKAPGLDGAVSHAGQDYPIQDGQVAVPSDAVDVLVERLGFARLDADAPSTDNVQDEDRPGRRRRAPEPAPEPVVEPASEVALDAAPEAQASDLSN